MAYDRELAERLRSELDGRDDVREKAMFGGLAFLINGNMAVAASGEGGLLVRADPAASETLIQDPHAERCVMRGREMDGWLRIAPEGTTADEDLSRWAAIGVARALVLPQK